MGRRPKGERPRHSVSTLYPGAGGQEPDRCDDRKGTRRDVSEAGEEGELVRSRCARCPLCYPVDHRSPCSMASSLSRTCSPSARRALCSYSFVTHSRIPGMCPAVCSEKAVSTYISS